MIRKNQSTRREFLQQTLTAGAVACAASTTVCRPLQAASGTDRDGYRIGIYTRPWAAFDYRVALDAIAEAGFQHAGLMTTTSDQGKLVISADTTIEQAAAVGEEVKQRGLEVPSVYGGPIPVQKSLEAGIVGMKRLIDNCVAAGARSLLMGGIGNVGLFDRYYKAIAECCDYAAQRDLPLTVKPHGGLNATGAQCRKCIQSVGHENFSLWYDPGNILFYSNGELDPVDDAASVNGLVTVGMCIKDFAMTLRDGKPTRNVALTPGDGQVDFPKVLAVLMKGGFSSGELVIECLAPVDGSLPAILAEAKRARQYVQQLIAG